MSRPDSMMPAMRNISLPGFIAACVAVLTGCQATESPDAQRVADDDKKMVHPRHSKGGTRGVFFDDWIATSDTGGGNFKATCQKFERDRISTVYIWIDTKHLNYWKNECERGPEYKSWCLDTVVLTDCDRKQGIFDGSDSSKAWHTSFDTQDLGEFFRFVDAGDDFEKLKEALANGEIQFSISTAETDTDTPRCKLTVYYAE